MAASPFFISLYQMRFNLCKKLVFRHRSDRFRHHFSSFKKEKCRNACYFVLLGKFHIFIAVDFADDKFVRKFLANLLNDR